MSIWKPNRLFILAAVIGCAAVTAEAGCPCSVPPSPAVSAAAPWNDQTTLGGWSGYCDPYGYGPAGAVGGQAVGGTAFVPSPGGAMSVATPGAPYNPNGATWAPGGYEPRVGSPVYYHDPSGGQYSQTGDPHYDHFGPGYHRNSLYGHYRFPYYSYRAPWYYPGRAVYNRDTNFPW